jgi:D-inositol-3-phosphate glycosyltransferase
VGGLVTTVSEGHSGLLVDGHEPQCYADALSELLADAELRRSLSTGALAHAAGFDWDRTVDGVIDAYADALSGAAARSVEGLPVAAAR